MIDMLATFADVPLDVTAHLGHGEVARRTARRMNTWKRVLIAGRNVGHGREPK